MRREITTILYINFCVFKIYMKNKNINRKIVIFFQFKLNLLGFDSKSTTGVVGLFFYASGFTADFSF